MGTLVRLELFKLRKRWLPWILLTVMAAFLAMGQFGMLAAYQSTKSAPPPPAEETPDFLPQEQREEMIKQQQAGHQQFLDRMAETLTYPRALEGIFGISQSVGGILLVILTASVVGGEYAWGTVRVALARGIGRRNYLTAKLIAVMLLSLLGLLIALFLGSIFAGITTRLIEGGIDWSFLSLSLAGKLLAMIGRTWFVLLVPISMTAMVVVLTRSSAAATGVGIAYGLLETIVIVILAQITGWGETLRSYTIGYNVNSIIALNSLGGEPLRVGINLGNFPTQEPSLLNSGGILAGYLLAFLLAMFYSFQKRDITA